MATRRCAHCLRAVNARDGGYHTYTRDGRTVVRKWLCDHCGLHGVVFGDTPAANCPRCFPGLAGKP